MRIKKVVIQGFKTFARRTEFLFDPGITAVVGPNGSGKSNVVDAVRWCLGEQSFAMLRSKKTSDVIFSGSDKKARLSMAEVTLTLDNSGGELPIAFSELEITRRAYRDGDNEYLINGKKVRLQDIVELLAQTGLGRRTYSVVGQGLIDRALSLAPDERRALFEEAAGITGYQLKRSAAVRRLEATRLNLTRIVDITTELAPRLSLLKRQADRTRERERVATDLKLLLREWYGFRWHRTLKQVEDQVAVELQLRTTVVSRQEELALAGGEIERQRLRQSELRGEVGGLHGRRSELHRAAEQINRQLAVVEERMRQLTDRSEESRRELAPLQAQESMLADRRAALEQELAAARTAATERARAAEEIQHAVGQRQQQRRTTQDAVDSARKALKQVQDQVADAGSRLAQTGERAITLLAEQQRQQELVAKLESESTAAEQRLREGELTGQQLEQQAAALQATLKASEDEGNRLRGQLKSAEEARQAAERVADRLQTRFDLLNRLRNEGAGYAGGVRTIMQAANTDRRLAGVLGTVAAQIRVPGELEKAVETALGGALQNVIVHRWDDAATAIDWLKQNRGGRATFLPLDRLHVQQPIPAPRLAGVLGVAADLVDYDRSVETAVEHLLNRTWIVQTLDVGRRALDTLGGGPRPTVVTTDGDIIRPGGAVSGGSDTSRNDDSLLTRERELRDLPAQITAAQTTAREAVAACVQFTRAIEAVRLHDTQQRQSVADLARRDRQQRQSLDESRRQWDRSREALRWQQERLQQLAGEESVLTSRRDGLQVMLASLHANEAAAQSRLVTAETELAAAGADDLLQELAQRRAAAAEAQGDLRSRQALLETVGRNWQAVTEQITTKEQRLAMLEEESHRLQGEIDLQAAEQQRATGRAAAGSSSAGNGAGGHGPDDADRRHARAAAAECAAQR
jgi:chromosome segregation protein